MTSHWFGIVTLLAALLIGYRAITGNDSSDIGNTSAQPIMLGFYLKDAIITETSASGAPQLRFAASEVVENKSDNSVTFETVRIDYLASNNRQALEASPLAQGIDRPKQSVLGHPVLGEHWVLNANQAKLPLDSKQITLQGDVEAHNMSNAHNATLNTQSLIIDTAKEVAHSIDVVKVNFDNHALIGSGLVVDLKKQHVQLQSDVEIHFASTKRDTSNNPDAQPFSLPGVFYSESSDYQNNVLVLNKVRSKVSPLIEADQARANGDDLANNKIVLSGAVRLELPQNGQLTADVATVNVQNSQISKVHITGKPVKFQHQPRNSKKTAHGRANTIDYNVLAQTLSFYGGAWFSDGEIELTSDKIDYDIRTGHAHSNRSTIIFKPRTKANEATIEAPATETD